MFICISEESVGNIELCSEYLCIHAEATLIILQNLRTFLI